MRSQSSFLNSDDDRDGLPKESIQFNLYGRRKTDGGETKTNGINRKVSRVVPHRRRIAA